MEYGLEDKYKADSGGHAILTGDYLKGTISLMWTLISKVSKATPTNILAMMESLRTSEKSRLERRLEEPA